MTEKKILFIDTAHPVLVEDLEAMGFKCDHYPGITHDEVEKIIYLYSGVIIRSKVKFDKALIDKARNLEFIGRVGAGMESIDVDYCMQKGIKCLNSPEGSRDALGEHTVGMLLSLVNNIIRSDAEVRNGIWKREENRGFEIKGRTVGIIGYGNMGSALAERLVGFGTRVIAYDKYKKNYGNAIVEEVDMDTVYRETDILSLHVPLTDETRYLVNKDYLAKFEKPVILINTSRGPVVKTDDLVEQIKAGRVLGAALDVLEYERFSFEKLDLKEVPEPFKYLIKSDKVVLTPHIAGWTVESMFKLSKVLATKTKNEFDL